MWLTSWGTEHSARFSLLDQTHLGTRFLAADQFLTSLTKDWSNCGGGATVPVNLQLLISPNHRVSPGGVEDTLWAADLK